MLELRTISRDLLKRKQLLDEIKKRVAQYDDNKTGLYRSLVALGWSRRLDFSPEEFQGCLLEAEVSKIRASEIRVILEAEEAVVPEFLKKTSWRQALKKARQERRKRRLMLVLLYSKLLNGQFATDGPESAVQPAHKKPEPRHPCLEIVEAAEDLIGIMLNTLTPKGPVWELEHLNYCFRFEASAEELARMEAEKITPS